MVVIKSKKRGTWPSLPGNFLTPSLARTLFTLSHSLSLSLTHTHTLTLSHSHSLTLSNSRTLELSNSLTLSHSLSHSLSLSLSLSHSWLDTGGGDQERDRASVLGGVLRRDPRHPTRERAHVGGERPHRILQVLDLYWRSSESGDCGICQCSWKRRFDPESTATAIHRGQGHPPRERAHVGGERPNRLYQVLDLYWRSPESGDCGTHQSNRKRRFHPESIHRAILHANTCVWVGI